MAFTDRSQIVRKQRSRIGDRGEELFAGILLGALIATLGCGTCCRPMPWRPRSSTLLFALGAATAGFALLCRRDQAPHDVVRLAGSLTFVGVAVSILIEPDQMVRLLTLSDQPD